MSALLLTELSLDVVFDRLCDLLSSFIEATTVYIVLRNPDNSYLEFRYDNGKIHRIASAELPQQELISKTFAAESGFICEDPAALFTPLIIGEETIGILSIQSAAVHRYCADELMLLESIAPYVAVAIRNRMLQDALYHEKYRAEHDALTGLANRMLFNDRLAQAMHRADRSGELVGLLFADLDGFKAINDTLGHHAGDVLLKTVAKRLAHTMRTSDTVARLGGDEFAMIVENLHDKSEIDKIIDKATRTVLEPIPIEGKDVNVGVSIGCSVYPLDSVDVTTLLERADQSMYAIKASHPHAHR